MMLKNHCETDGVVTGEAALNEAELSIEASIVALEELPAAACIVRTDFHFSIVACNEAFYNEFGYSKDEIQYKYGNRLGAMIADGLPELQQLLDGQAASVMDPVDHRLSNGIWVRHQAKTMKIGEEQYILCMFFDVSAMKEMEQRLEDYQQTARFVSAATHTEVFRYDIISQKAEVYGGDVILGQVTPQDQEHCRSFQNAIISKGIVEEEFLGVFENLFINIQYGVSNACEVKVRDAYGNSYWVNISLELPVKDGLEKKRAFGVLKDISQQHALMMRYLTETQCYQALLSEKDAYALVCIEDNKILFTGGIWSLYNELVDKITYSQLVGEFIQKVVHPEDRKHYLELMQPENFYGSIDMGIDFLGCQFRRILEQNKMVWMELTVHLFRHSADQKLMALLLIKNVDKEKRQALELTHMVQNLQKNPLPEDRTRDRDAMLLGMDPEEEAFHSFLGEQGEIAYLVDIHTYELLLGNKALYERVGRTKEQCRGMKCYEIMHNRDNPCPFCNKANWNSEKFYQWKDQNQVLEQDFLIKNKLVQWQGREVLLALAIDISNNKSIQDSMENSLTESHSILSGTQRMMEAKDLDEAMTDALETIGYFFRADIVQLWRRQRIENDEPFACLHQWGKRDRNMAAEMDQRVMRIVNEWVRNKKWDKPITVGSPEVMMSYSFEMYQLMQQEGIQNQKWIPLIEEGELFGLLAVKNITINFQNITFMENFSGLITGEWKRRVLIEGVLYANSHDELTKLLSRSSYEKYLKDYDADGVSSVGIVVLDINDLKGINSRRGFHMGDRYIRQLANMMQKVFYDASIFRLNGDEFLVIDEGVKREQLHSRIDILDRQLKNEKHFSVSMGYAWDDQEKDLGALFATATKAMKVNKKLYYDSVGNVDAQERREMLRELMEALERKEFEVFLQPKINLSTGKLFGAEALVRFRHKEFGLISPGKFINILERNNFIRYVDLFVFEQVCGLIERWQDMGIDSPIISMNYSRLTLLEQDILASTETVFNKYRIPKEKLEIEITESIMAIGKSILYQVVHDFCKAGYSIALDDFGTKYTNLALLSELDFDMLKLDKSMISSLAKREEKQIVLKNMISMCSDLKIGVVAEGVETRAQRHLLHEMGCQYGQGYLFGKPMPIPEFETFYFSNSK